MPPLEETTARFLDAWLRLRQIVQAANFNRFQREGLSATQFMTINAIPRAGATLSELARRLNLSPASLNQTVNSLEERRLVRRTRDRTDARKVNIAATPLGQSMQNAASTEFHRSMAEIFRGMSPSNRESLLAGLEEMVQLGEQQRPGSEPVGSK